ncbi:YSC84-related protein [Planktotalea sp.]|uniref:lipid-binding SYLF domain-containing protein n=1 Tax=Planktotalea sp. TaxID=2029877 RepID=UPI003D6BF1C8
MTTFSRRAFALSGIAGVFALGACDNRRNNSGIDRLEGRVDATLSQMYADFPKTRSIAARSTGMLVMPLITEAGLGFGGGFGRGALRIGGTSVDYFTATKANFGLQIGANQYAHVLFFMTEEALRDFRESDGWAAGADVDASFLGAGETLSTNTATAMSPVVGIIFGQAGIRLGATIEGTKYSRMFEN